jgi:hypothetical protein
MRVTTIYIASLTFLVNFSTAQDSQDSQDPTNYPACSTMLSIALSCEEKLVDAATITASVFNCLCFDGSGKYVPTFYDNAVAGCSSQYPDQSTDFDFWLPGFCTNSNYATNAAPAASTTVGGSATVVAGLTGIPTTNTIGAVSHDCLWKFEVLLMRIGWVIFDSYSESRRSEKHYDFEPDFDYSCSNQFRCWSR